MSSPDGGAKREIVAESLAPALTPTEVARNYGISTGQLYTSHRQAPSTQTTLLIRAASDFAPCALPPRVRVYLAFGVTNMRKGMVGFAMLVQPALSEDPVIVSGTIMWRRCIEGWISAPRANSAAT